MALNTKGHFFCCMGAKTKRQSFTFFNLNWKYVPLVAQIFHCSMYVHVYQPSEKCCDYCFCSYKHILASRWICKYRIGEYGGWPVSASCNKLHKSLLSTFHWPKQIIGSESAITLCFQRTHIMERSNNIYRWYHFFHSLIIWYLWQILFPKDNLNMISHPTLCSSVTLTPSFERWKSMLLVLETLQVCDYGGRNTVWLLRLEQ